MAKKKVGDQEFVCKDAREVLGDNTIKSANNHRAEISPPSDLNGRKTKYSLKYAEHKLYFVKGFNFLQYNLIVRDFIVKRYLLKNQQELDVLCYLMPFQYFTLRDFKLLPVKGWGISFKQMSDDGHIDIKIKKAGRGATIYGLSENAKSAVMDYHLYLSGEKTISIKSQKNPYRHLEQTKVDLERERVMLKLKKQSERYPKLFKNFHD